MKKLILIIFYCFASTVSPHAQSLFGVTYRGGNDAGGTINKYTIATNDLAVEQSFQRTGANPYYTNLIQATNGKLYGTTFNGGGSSGGVIFSCDPASATYIKLYDFDITNGSKPTGSLLQASDGKLYGLTSFGGAENVGVIFSFDIATNTYTKLYDFDNTNGAGPAGSLIQLKNGLLYGTTAQGGTSNAGVIFSFNPVSSVYSDVKDFDITNGLSPVGDLLEATDGLLYGMTVNGGTSQSGVIFSFNPVSAAYNKLQDLDSARGNYPSGSLTQAANGKLYGMTYKGGSNNDGVIFSFNINTSTYAKLYDLDSANGSDPFGNVVQAADGKLYGLTSQGGADNLGVVFSFDTSSSVYTKLQNLDNASGAMPFGSFVQATDGKLYAMTFQGGDNNTGVIFSFDPSADAYAKLKDFGTNVNGRNLSGSLVKASNGKLYGMTVFGGSDSRGVIFSFDPATSVYLPLVNFDSANGANPYGSLVQAKDGKLYGMTYKGGAHNAGVIFSYDIASSAYTKLRDMDSATGCNPYGSLLQAIDGKLYGMTFSGGTAMDGTIFSFDPVSDAYIKLKDFNYTDGANPYGSLVQAANGLLYGLTNTGGNSYVTMVDTTGAGLLFSFNPSSLSYNIVRDFDYYNDGGFPTGSLLLAKDGALYGMASKGGSNDIGTVFSFDILKTTFTKVTDFNYTDGATPYGNLMQAGDGKLYGATYAGGSDNFGVIFSLDPSSKVVTQLVDYTDDNGANPYYGSAFIEVPQSGPLPVTLLSFTGKNNGGTNFLSWKVISEQQLRYYELQRSTDNINFTAVYKADANGNKSYTFNDAISTSQAIVYFYRLKSVDLDGKVQYSSIVKLSRETGGYIVTAFPNPFINNLAIMISTLKDDKADIVITNLQGQQLFKTNKPLYQGTNIIMLLQVNKLPAGSYLITISTSQKSQIIKVIKNN